MIIILKKNFIQFGIKYPKAHITLKEMKIF